MEPGGLGVSVKQVLEFVEEASLFRASLPLYHVVILSPEFILVNAMYIITLILKGGQQKKKNKYKDGDFFFLTMILMTEELLQWQKLHTWNLGADLKFSAANLEVDDSLNNLTAERMYKANILFIGTHSEFLL